MKIIGMLPVYNDEDVIEEVIEHLISEGIELVVLDNGSTDNSYKLCEKFLGKGILELKHIITPTYEWDLLLRMLYDMALIHSPTWLIRSDSDEILESGYPGRSLKDAIEEADSDGHNLIQFDRFDFYMTDKDDSDPKSIRKKMRYYSYLGDFLYRAWKYYPGIRIGDAEGHYPIFPTGTKYKISPRKFILRHYPFRSEEQAKTKMKNRIRGRKENENSDQKLDQHEKKVLEKDFAQRFNHNLLSKYNDDGKWIRKIIFSPFNTPRPLKKEDLFTSNGELKNKPKTVYQYKKLLAERESKLVAKLLLRNPKLTVKTIFSRILGK